MRDLPVPQSQCTKCHTPLELATNLADANGPGPEPGNITFCLYCGAVNVFDDELQLREPTQADLQIVEASPEMVSARRRILQYLALYKHGRDANQVNNG